MRTGFQRLGGWVAALLCSISIVSSPARAVEFKSGENVTVGRNEIVDDDLYMTGDTMTIKGRVVGDVVAAGRMLIIEGVVEGDLIAAGQAIVIKGEIKDDVRIAGMAVRLEAGARIGDDAFAGGFAFESEAGSRVEGKTGIRGYQAVLAGHHQQGLEASVVALRLAGDIQGDVKATVVSEASPAWWIRYMRSPVPLLDVVPGLALTADARVVGDLMYRSISPATIDPAAEVDGQIHHEAAPVRPETKPSFAKRVGTAMRWLAVWFLIGSVLLWFMPYPYLGIADTLVRRPAASLGWGFVTLVGFPIAMLLVLVLAAVLIMAFGITTLGQGAILAGVLGGLAELVLAAKLWIALFYLVPSMIGFVIGQWILSKVSDQAKSRFLQLLVGLVLLTAVTLVPYFGAAIRVVMVIMGLGAGSLWSVRYLATAETS